jgi:hypothetical protein
MSLATPAGARSMLQGRGRVAPAPSFASFTGCVGLVGLLLALASTAVAAAPPADVRLSARGIGPLVLGVPLVEASRQTVPLDPAAAMIGPGCDERDQITVVLQVAGQAMSVMAMANARGHIEEILATPAGNAGVRLADAEACHAHGADFAAGLAATLGPMQAWSVQHKPVSIEFTFFAAGATPARGGARVVSRWFAGGRTCDLLLQFGGRQPEP